MLETANMLHTIMTILGFVLFGMIAIFAFGFWQFKKGQMKGS